MTRAPEHPTHTGSQPLPRPTRGHSAHPRHRITAALACEVIYTSCRTAVRIDAWSSAMHAEDRRLRVLLIEDDAPLMRTMAWALSDDGFDVEVVSKRHALEMHGLEAPDVAVFNMQATSSEKSAYNNQLRMLDPDIVIIDVDEFAANGGSVRDSGADSYTARPLALEAIINLIREMTSKPLDERRRLRVARADALRALLPADTPPVEADGPE